MADAGRKMSSAGTTVVADGLHRLSTTGIQADVVIECRQKEWQAHKAVLYIRSEPLSKACMDERFKEGRTGRITLDEDESGAIAAMMHYMYHSDYPSPTEGTDQLAYHLEVLFIADKYRIAHLNIDAHNKFMELAPHQLQSQDFVCALRTAYHYAVAAKELCGSIVNMLLSDIKLVKDFEQFDEMLDEVPEFAADVARRMVRGAIEADNKYPNEKRFRHCGPPTFKADIPDVSEHTYGCFWCFGSFKGTAWQKWVVED